MRRWQLAAWAYLSVGCAGLRPQLVEGSVQRPSNVAVYFTVSTSRGEPVPGLSADDFRIYEDDKIVSPFESKQTILNPEVAAVHSTLLLVDMSGSVTGSGQLPPLEDAVASFTDRVGRYQETAIYAFDGRADIFPIRSFAGGNAKATALSSFRTQDPSTNLNGAVVQAIRVLENHLEKSQLPLRFGTLVIFTDGTDHAHRVSTEEVQQALDGVNFDVLVIGVGAEIDEHELSALGRSGVAFSKDPNLLREQFDRIASRIEGFSKSFYLLSYCSPARAGEHDLKVEPLTPDGKKGWLTYHFNANGFGPACDPNRRPNFDIRHPRPKATVQRLHAQPGL